MYQGYCSPGQIWPDDLWEHENQICHIKNGQRFRNVYILIVSGFNKIFQQIMFNY